MLATLVMEHDYSFCKCVWVDRNLHVESGKGSGIEFFLAWQWKAGDQSPVA